MSRFVVDSSVAVKWVLPEIHAEAARRLLVSDYTLLVPDFFFPEVGNVLWKRVRWAEFAAEDARIALDSLQSQPLQVCLSQPLITQALNLALQTQRAVYDCVYLALAVEHQCQMVTADEKFYNALRNDSLKIHLLWVEDLP